MKISSEVQCSQLFPTLPMLRLAGKWLAKAHLDIGQLIEIEVKHGKLLIRFDKRGLANSESTTAQ